MPQINSFRGLSSIKAISKCEVNLTSDFQATAFTNNILHRVQCYSPNCCGGHFDFRRMPQINSFRGLSSIKAISKDEVNQISGFRDIGFKSNCGQTDGPTDRKTDGWTDRQTDRAMP